MLNKVGDKISPYPTPVVVSNRFLNILFSLTDEVVLLYIYLIAVCKNKKSAFLYIKTRKVNLKIAKRQYRSAVPPTNTNHVRILEHSEFLRWPLRSFYIQYCGEPP